MIEILKQNELAVDQNTLDFVARQSEIILIQSDENFIIQNISANCQEFGMEIEDFIKLPLESIIDFHFSIYMNKSGLGINGSLSYQLSIPSDKLSIPEIHTRRNIHGLLSYSPSGHLISSLWTIHPSIKPETQLQKKVWKTDYKQDLFKNLFETAGDAIFVMNGNNFIDCNQMALDMFACTRDQIINHSPFEFSPKLQPDGRSSKESAIEKIRKSISGETLIFEWLHCKRDGTPFYAQVSLNALNINGEVLIQAIVRDINETKKASQKLAYSEEFNRKLMDASPMGIMHLDREGRITYENLRMSEIMSGVKQRRPELIGRRVFDFPGIMDGSLGKYLSEVFQGKSVLSKEIRYTSIHGRTIDLELNGAPMCSLKGEMEGAIIIVEDIGRRLKAEAEIIQIDKMYRLIFENSPLGIGMSTYKGQLLAYNQKLADYFGYSEEEFKAMSTSQLYTNQQDRESVLAILNEEGRVKDFKVSFRRKDGSEFFAEINIHPYEIDGEEAMMVVVNDITNRIESEENIRVLSSSVEQSPASIVITDKQGHIEYINSKFTQVSGKTLEDVKGKSAIGMISRFNSSELIDQINTELLNKGKVISEIQNETGNGDKIWERFQVSTIVNSKQEVTHYLGIHEDITSQKTHAMEMERAREIAEKSDKVKTVFLATMSHELRTPLNAIIGFSSLIESDSENPETRSFGNIINKSGQHLLSIINDMFDISVIESGNIKLYKEQFKISNFFEETYQVLRADQERTGKFHIELSRKIPKGYNDQMIVTDKGRLSQIFVNLLKNAFKFTESGSIEFGISQVEGSSITFYVKDTGVGIPKEQQGLIFNLFQQVDDIYTRKSSGAGIGLALCKKLVECMGGSIALESEAGIGSTFYVTLNEVIPRIQIEPVRKSTSSIVPDLKGNLILIAEDEESNFRLLKAWVERTGANIVWVKDGQEAVDYIAGNPQIDLILMDVKMPRLNGYKATQLIKQMQPDIPIVVQTAYALSGDVEKAMLSGCNSYVSKPVSKSKLYKELTKYLVGK
ncbi:MAG: PAS domain S-box protein [Bacteroidales bacterium]|nr:PAS domain S-box protein [Bacteroidales bacterium]MCF8456927.1 PAS domain S-box protein [Bacteroidales bacterium]